MVRTQTRQWQISLLLSISWLELWEQVQRLLYLQWRSCVQVNSQPSQVRSFGQALSLRYIAAFVSSAVLRKF